MRARLGFQGGHRLTEVHGEINRIQAHGKACSRFRPHSSVRVDILQFSNADTHSGHVG
jgi:hypothetical protein